jgi:hypothetical protein
MNPKERLYATLRGEVVDRPAVSFYEINGLDERLNHADPYTIYSHPSWKPLIDLAEEKTDRIVMRHVPFINTGSDSLAQLTSVRRWEKDGSRYEQTTIRAGKHTLTQLTRRDRDVNTIWVLEHLLKTEDDLRAYLALPPADTVGDLDPANVLTAEHLLGDSGIVMIDTADPICQAATLFDMSVYTVIATQEPRLFHQLLERFAQILLPRTEKVAQALPGRLWRIYGPEYASPPYLKPRLFNEYVTQYDRQMVQLIQKTGGYARIHSHGRLRLLLDEIASMGAVGLDPIEPPPQGDMSLWEVRERIGQQMVLFGNLEASDLENLDENGFRQKVHQALREGPGGRGFVLMPSSCPYGRILTNRARRNYEVIIEEVERYGGTK